MYNYIIFFKLPTGIDEVLGEIVPPDVSPDKCSIFKVELFVNDYIIFEVSQRN